MGAVRNPFLQREDDPRHVELVTKIMIKTRQKKITWQKLLQVLVHQSLEGFNLVLCFPPVNLSRLGSPQVGGFLRSGGMGRNY